MHEGRIDYRLQRRALLRDVAAGRAGRDDVCDAHPELLRAGRHLGAPAGDPCPICGGPDLVRVSYVFEGRGRTSPGGRAVAAESLPRQAERHGRITVYVVEVCPSCAWHHLVESYRMHARGSAVG